MKLKTSDTIPLIALIVSVVSALFTGLTYYSGESAKRADLSILIEGKNVFSYNLTSPEHQVFGLTVWGQISNEGPRMTKVEKLSLSINFRILSSIDSHLIEGDIVKIGTQYGLGNASSFGWTDFLFKSRESKIFNLTALVPAMIYGTAWQPKPENIIDCSIEIAHDDGMGIRQQEKIFSYN